MNIDAELTLERRAAALLSIRFAMLARTGKPIAAAYVNNPPTPRVVWNKKSWTH